MLKTLIPLLSISVCAMAQDNPFSGAIKAEYGIARMTITRAAEKMPEDNYAFQPTPEIRTFGQLVGHVADAQYLFCSTVLGEKSPATGSNEKTKTSKADLVAALKDAFAYCDKAYAMTDATAAEPVKFFGNPTNRLGVLAFSNMHDYEHYGNMVTYMRLKGIVPPSSEPRPTAKPPSPDKR
jgi:uncharacterized damage-inducible protein DinB